MGLNNCCFCIPLRIGVTAIAVASSALYIAILIWLINGRGAVYSSFSQQDLSAALAVFWTSVAIVGLYSVSSLFGVIGGITQNRSMVNIFRFLYWTVAVLLLLSSSIIWILMMIKQNAIVEGCQQYLTEITTGNSATTTSSSSYYTPVNLPNGASLHKEDCVTATKQLLIVSGVVVFVGNFLQLYFAVTINAYAKRLKSGTMQHQKLRNLDDFPETAKLAVY